MKYNAVKRDFRNLLYIYFKKHTCPHCNNQLKPVKVAEVVDASSERAKDFDFSLADTILSGKVKFIWTELKCDDCGRQFTVDYIKNK